MSAMDPSTRSLTAEHLQEFRSRGFCIVRGLLGEQAIERLAAWTDELHAWPEVKGRHMMYFEQSRLDGARILNRLENFLPYHEGLAGLSFGPLCDAVGELLGEPCVLFKDKINFKLPGGDGFAAHQDAQAGWCSYAPLHVTALISIDASSVANGCLEMAPRPEQAELVESEWSPLSEEACSLMDFTSVETVPGDALFFDSFVPHRSGPNQTDQPRRVLYVTYNRSSDGDSRERYYADKRASYPPDIERDPDKDYVFRV